MLLSQDHGEGRLTYRALKAGGFSELSAIADSPVRAIADRGHFSMQTAQRLKTGAREMMSKGLGAPPSRSSRTQARGSKPDAPHPRAPRGFSDGITRLEALTLQRDESQQPAEAPQEAPPPEPSLPEPPPQNGEPAETFWSFG
jgi:hypothetical protein